MNAASPDLASLAARATVARPPHRWKVRVLLPVVILTTTLGLLAYAARDTFYPRTGVWVVPVVAKPGATEASPSSGSLLAQAPGWIEPSPFATHIAAFTEGVVRDVIAHEGQHVSEGQVVARLDDQDARLALRRAEAELVERQADVELARANHASAKFRVDEIRDSVDRKRALVPIGGVPAGEFAQLEFRLKAAEQDVAAAQASLAAAEAATRTHAVRVEEADLALNRTEVRSPAAGVILSRHIEPGTRIQFSETSSGDRMTGTILRLYNPDKLQARVDIPLADAAKITAGTPAQVVTEALPDTTFDGRVILLGQEANIQRNTVPVKVVISTPSPALKPEMLVRVRFFSTQGSAAPGASSRAASTIRLFVPETVLLQRVDAKATVWCVDATGSLAQTREVTISGERSDGYIGVAAGLNPGDRLILDPPASLKPGARIRILGEKPESRPAGATP